MDRTSSSRARRTCETCNSIDVRDWHRRGLLRVGPKFEWSWTRSGQPSGSIRVRSEGDAVILTYRFRAAGQAELKRIEQHVPLEWTGCNFGGRRPWFSWRTYERLRARADGASLQGTKLTVGRRSRQKIQTQ